MTTVRTDLRLDLSQLLWMRFSDEHRPSVSDLRDTIDGLDALLMLSALAEAEAEQPRLTTFAPQRRVDLAKGLVSNIEIRRLTLNSPLDVYLSVGALVGLGSYIAMRVVNVFNAVDNVRVRHAQSNTEVTRAKLEEDLLQVARRSLEAGIQSGGARLKQPVEDASRVLIEMRHAEVLPDENLPERPPPPRDPKNR